MTAEHTASKDTREKDLSGKTVVIYLSSLPGTIGGMQSCTQALVETAISKNAAVVWAHPARQASHYPNMNWVNDHQSQVDFLPLPCVDATDKSKPSPEAIKTWIDVVTRSNDANVLVNMPNSFGRELALALPAHLVEKTTLYVHGMIDLSPQAVSSFDPVLQIVYAKSESTRERLRTSYRTLRERGFRFMYVSERVRGSFVRNGIITENDEYDIVPPPTDLCHDCPRAKQETEKDIRGDADFVVLTTGRIEERKGAENLIRLAQETSKVVANKQVHFLVVGATDNTGYTAELGDKFSTFNSQGLNCQINLLPAQTGNDLCDYYNAADAFAFSSITESFGLVAVEAAAHGLPVISWGEEDTLKTITSLPQMGFSIPCPNPQDIHERTKEGALFIKSLIENSEFRQSTSQTAKALALSNYNPEDIIQTLLSRIVK